MSPSLDIFLRVGIQGTLPVDGQPCTVRYALENIFDIQGPISKSTLRLLSSHINSEALRARLSASSTNTCAQDSLKEVNPFASLADFLEKELAVDWTRQVHWTKVLGSLRRLSPRYYSIASSPNYNSDECSLLVKLLRHRPSLPSTPIWFEGLCSRFIVDLKAGSEVWVHHRTTEFRLPRQFDRPMVMVCESCDLLPISVFILIFVSV